MGSIFYDHKTRSRYQLGGSLTRGRDWHDAVGIAVNYQCGNINAGHVFAEIFIPRRHASKAGRGRRTDSNIPARLHRRFANALSHQNVSVEEVFEELGEKGVTIRCNRLLD